MSFGSGKEKWRALSEARYQHKLLGRDSSPRAHAPDPPSSFPLPLPFPCLLGAGTGPTITGGQYNTWRVADTESLGLGEERCATLRIQTEPICDDGFVPERHQAAESSSNIVARLLVRNFDSPSSDFSRSNWRPNAPPDSQTSQLVPAKSSEATIFHRPLRSTPTA
jgi:hypothetical protein